MLGASCSVGASITSSPVVSHHPLRGGDEMRPSSQQDARSSQSLFDRGGLGAGGVGSSGRRLGGEDPRRQATERDRLIPTQTSSLLTAANTGVPTIGSSDTTAFSTSTDLARGRHLGQTLRERRTSRSPLLQQDQDEDHRQSTGWTGGKNHPMGRGRSRTSRDGGTTNTTDRPFPSLPGEGNARSTATYDSTDSSYDTYGGEEDASRTSRHTYPIDRQRQTVQAGGDAGDFPPSSNEQQVQQPHVPRQPYYGDFRQQYYNDRANRILGDGAQGPGGHGGEPPPLLEIPEEIYAVRRAALTVLEPLTLTWLIVAIGFALTVALGMSRWTGLLPRLPYWFILLPSWLAHVGLLVCHITAARALSAFIAEANENRQRHDSTDHLDRTEYLPLLQRSLKFGLKTGLLSFCIFVFEVLIYLRVSRNAISLGVALIPLWILVIAGVLDGIMCKTQHFLRVICWVLMCISMLLAVLKIDHGVDSIRWRIVVMPIIALLSISSASLIYIVYGHQIGYFRLTESQLTAGILYSMSALMCIVLVVIIGEVIPLTRPVEIETRVFVVTLAALVIALVGMGAWAVTRDEFDRLLQYGGQAAVHPMKLKLEPSGWTAVESKGVAIIPMFGEVSYHPLDASKSNSIELCACCACYPFEEVDEGTGGSQEARPQQHGHRESRDVGNSDYKPAGPLSPSPQENLASSSMPQGLTRTMAV